MNKSKNLILKSCAAAAMLLVPLPLMLLFDGTAFEVFSVWRYVIYYALSVIPVAAGYLLIAFKRSRTTPKSVFAANILLGFAALLLSAAVIISVNIASANTDQSFNSFYLCIALIPAVVEWLFTGTRLYKKAFSDVFTMVWLGVYITETFFCYIFCSILNENHKQLSYSSSGMVYLFIVMALLTVLLINQSNIDTQISQRRNTNLIVPKGLKRYNAKLISIVGLVILAVLLLKDIIASGLRWFAKITLQIIDYILFSIQFQQQTDPIAEEEQTIIGEELASSEGNKDFILYIVIIIAVVLLIVFRRQIIAFFKSVASKIFRKLSVDNTADETAYDYTDSYEAIDIKTTRLKPETADNCLKRYRKSKNPNEKFRLGYRLYMMWLAKRSRDMNGNMTVEQHMEQAEKLYHGDKDISVISDGYSKVRYNDESADSDSLDRMDKLVNELYK